MALDWDSWIGQEQEPDESSLTQPPVLDDILLSVDEEAAQHTTELLTLAEKFMKESPTFTLPTPETYSDIEAEGVKLEPELIKGVLRRGHKMMVSGASKSGKSFMMIEMALCLAEGRPWMGYECMESKVLYVNLEISKPSFNKRIADVSESMKLHGWNNNLKIVNLRGMSVELGKMVGSLIGTCLKEEAETGVPYSAIILDPIYKISNGEENSAKDVGTFCHYLDQIANYTGASVIYTHHHSKGDQGYKSAQDRASGSGVFARDADAMIDMIELEIDKDTYGAMKSYYACSYWIRLLDEKFDGWRDDVSDETLKKSGDLAALYQKHARLTSKVISYMNENIEADFQTTLKGKTPIRIEFTLREFASPDPVNCFFAHPVHVPDESGVLSAADPVSHIQGQKKEKVREANRNKQVAFYEATCQIITEKGFATYSDITEVLGYKDDTIRKRLEELKDEFEVVKGGGKEKSKIYFRGEAPVD